VKYVSKTNNEVRLLRFLGILAAACLLGIGQEVFAGRTGVPEPFLPSAPDREPFTFVVIPDSQFMICSNNGGTPAQFAGQIGWIKSHIKPLNIKAVSHLGDIADSAFSRRQWDDVGKAIGDLEEYLPFGMAYGNHEYCAFLPDYAVNKVWLTNHFRPTFPVSDFAGKSWFGGSFPEGVMDNNYELFSGGGVDFILLHLGDSPDMDALKWAGDVLDKHHDRKAVISTHSYMGASVYSKGPASIWHNVIRSHDNVFMVVCGHDCRENMIVGTNIFGHRVFQILTDYQCDEPQAARLRYYTFVPRENVIKAYTYSTYLGEYEEDPDSRFDLPFDFGNPWPPVPLKLIGSSPGNNEAFVPLSTTDIALTFNSNMNGPSVAAGTTLRGPGVDGTSCVSGDGEKTVILRIIGRLKSNSSYTLGIGPGPKTSGGSRLDETESAVFSTEKMTRLPGILQAEDYIPGGEGAGYHDGSVANTGGSYRTDDVDIENCSDVGAGFNVGWTDPGEWLIYEVDVPKSGVFCVTARVASGLPGEKCLSLSVDGKDISGRVSGDFHTGWQGWEDLVLIPRLRLKAGKHRLRIDFLTAGINLNYLEIINPVRR
jgi:hypothetical protein